jgi:hypothetical protein
MFNVDSKKTQPMALIPMYGANLDPSGARPLPFYPKNHFKHQSQFCPNFQKP